MTILEKQVEAGDKILRSILLGAKEKLELKIIKAAKESRFATSAAIRDKLYNSLAQEYVALDGQVEDFITSRTKYIEREWRKLAINDLPAGVYDQTFAQFDKKYFKDIVERISPTTVKKLAATRAQLGGMLAKDITNLRSAVVKVQRLGAASGMTGVQISRAMRDEVLSVNPAFSFIDASGREWKKNNYFDMLNRTVHANASREVYKDVMAEADMDLATIENGSASACEDCKAWEGKIISISGESDEYPSYDEAENDGVFHPNCFCFLSAYVPEKEEEKVEEIAAEEVAVEEEDIFKDMGEPAGELTDKDYENIFGDEE